MSAPKAPKKTRKRGPINVELEGWNGRWVMMGQSIHCVACHAGQDALYAAQAFQHAKDCALVMPSFQYPWYELRAALGHLPKVEL
jgi:hypothetical protein